MDKKQKTKRDEAVETLRDELEGRSDKESFTAPFVAHGGKPPAPPKQ